MSGARLLRSGALAVGVIGALAVVAGFTIDDVAARALTIVAGTAAICIAGTIVVATPRLQAYLRNEAADRARVRALVRDVEVVRRQTTQLDQRSTRMRATLDGLVADQRARSRAADRSATDTGRQLERLDQAVRRLDGDLSRRVADVDGRTAGRFAATVRAIEALTRRVDRLGPAADAPPLAVALTGHLEVAGWPPVAVESGALADAVRALAADRGDTVVRLDPAAPPTDVSLVVLDGIEGAERGLDAAIASAATTVASTSGPRSAATLERLTGAGFVIDGRSGPRGEIVLAGRRRPRHDVDGPPVNVFVLSTGRSGTATFATACTHLTNFTSGHEINARLVGEARLAYPPMHIEADNRLAWMLGGLAQRYDDRPVLYVHLIRDRAAVLASLIDRWDSPFRANITRAVGHGIITRIADWGPDEVADVCNFFIDTVTANITEFLRTRPAMELHLETLPDDFPAFLDRIGAEGDLVAAAAELTVRHNAG